MDDILEEVEGVASTEAPIRQEMPPGVDATQQRIWNYLAEQPNTST
jgi:hypothetical protein